MKTIKYIFLSVLALSVFACENENLEDLRDKIDNSPEPLPELTSGSADFSNYVAVGASFTAGFTDNALFIAAQENSFPNTLSKAFSNAGGGEFTQPWMSDNFGGLAAGGTRITDPRLVFGGAGPVPIESLVGPVTVGTDIVLNNPTGPFNNLGVPGAKSFHLVANGYGNLANFPAAANPYAVRLTGNTPNASILELAIAQNPTFFTLSEIGGNDVLGYATSGGDGSNPITDIATFDASLNALVTGLTATGAQGAIANLPNITSLSFFTTVPNNALEIDAATAANLTGFFQAVSGIFAQGLIQQGVPPQDALALAAQYEIVFNEGPNRFLIDVPASPSNPLGFRQMTQNELLLLTIDQGALAAGYGSVVLTPEVLQVLGILQAGGTPTPEQAGLVLAAVSGIDDGDALDSDEIDEIATATQAYNASISAVASGNGLALVDLNSVLAQASSTGINFDDYNLNTDLVFGGLVSLDGVHLTGRGYALMANSFLEAIDATYGSNFVASGNLAEANDFSVSYSVQLD